MVVRETLQSERCGTAAVPYIRHTEKLAWSKANSQACLLSAPKPSRGFLELEHLELLASQRRLTSFGT
jgi:hypothetical protein